MTENRIHILGVIYGIHCEERFLLRIEFIQKDQDCLFILFVDRFA